MEDKAQKRQVFVRRLLRWGRAHGRTFPWRVERDPFRVLVAEVLLQRSRGRTVALVYEQLFNRWPTVPALGEATEAEIVQVIRPLGLVRRAVTLKRLAQEIHRLGGVPRSVEDMMKLPGVGRYAASATAAAAFERRVPTVDGTSARVYRRYFGVAGERDSEVDDEIWRVADAAAPTRAAREWNWAVLDLAAEICLPKRPRCSACPLARDCSVGSARILGSSEPSSRITLL